MVPDLVVVYMGPNVCQKKVISVRGGLVVVDLAGPEEWEKGRTG